MESDVAADRETSALAPSAGRDWTDAELVEIKRLKEACEAHGYKEPECDHTDAGDPWCIIHDRDRSGDSILLHIARINRRYVVVFPAKKMTPRWFSTIQRAIDFALREVAAAPRLE
jgi:hypothetical protein